MNTPYNERPSTEDGVDSEKIEKLKEIIRKLHKGQNVETARAKFTSLIADVQPEEINVFRDGLESRDKARAAPGHPLHIYMEENRAILKAADRWSELCRAGHQASSGGPRRHIGRAGEMRKHPKTSAPPLTILSHNAFWFQGVPFATDIPPDPEAEVLKRLCAIYREVNADVIKS